jgi:hypothetical protein
METDENDRIVVMAYQTVICAAGSVQTGFCRLANWPFYAFLCFFVASPVSASNSSKIQNTAAVASLNNPPSNQNATRKTKVLVRQPF